jgi:hypothetical protein
MVGQRCAEDAGAGDDDLVRALIQTKVYTTK